MRVREVAAAARNLDLPGRRVLVAVSGGVDSVVLFHALHRLAGSLNLDLCIGHVNHGLRGEESDGDESAVRALACEYDVPVHFEPTELYTARWIEADDDQALKKFIAANRASMAEDHDGVGVFMARNAWHLNTTVEDWPDIRFLKTKETVPQ